MVHMYQFLFLNFILLWLCCCFVVVGVVSLFPRSLIENLWAHVCNDLIWFHFKSDTLTSKAIFDLDCWCCRRRRRCRRCHYCSCCWLLLMSCKYLSTCCWWWGGPKIKPPNNNCFSLLAWHGILFLLLILLIPGCLRQFGKLYTSKILYIFRLVVLSHALCTVCLFFLRSSPPCEWRFENLRSIEIHICECIYHILMYTNRWIWWDSWLWGTRNYFYIERNTPGMMWGIKNKSVLLIY